MMNFQKIAIGLGLVSLLALAPLVKAQPASVLSDAQLIRDCSKQMEKGASAITVEARHNYTPRITYLIVSYAVGESGGQKLLALDPSGCKTIQTDNSVFPMRGVPREVKQALAVDQANRYLSTHKGLKTIHGEYLAPEQVQAYKSLGVLVK
jgi:hypothetical protein